MPMISNNIDFIKNWKVSSFSHNAMNTVFQIFISGENEQYAEQVALEAFNEIDLLEDLLSRFRPNSDVSKINSLNEGKYAVVGEDTFKCLAKAVELFDLTDGSFDISLGDEIQSWKDNKTSMNQPTQSKMHYLFLDPQNFTVLVNKKINLDLGGIGKGYAAEKIADIFTEWEITNYLINCGNSTVKVKSTDTKLSWPISLTNPITNKVFKEYTLENNSISSSGIKKGNHIIDPATIAPIDNGRISCWVCSNDTIKTDVLSTAFMILDQENIENICSKDENLSCAILLEKNETELITFGNFFKY